MPTLDTLPLHEARASCATGQRAALLQEYIAYSQSLAPGQAAKLESGGGVRRTRRVGRQRKWDSKGTSDRGVELSQTETGKAVAAEERTKEARSFVRTVAGLMHLAPDTIHRIDDLPGQRYHQIVPIVAAGGEAVLRHLALRRPRRRGAGPPNPGTDLTPGSEGQ